MSWNFEGTLGSGADRVVAEVNFGMDLGAFGFEEPLPPTTCEPVDSIDVSFCDSADCVAQMYVHATQGEPLPRYDGDERWDKVDTFVLEGGSALVSID
jgi:hypothetical protein